ncbi:MAG: helix-turn-helix transcriptional regulator [Thermoguttaceae bacterium]|jgi:hypothetical protein
MKVIIRLAEHLGEAAHQHGVAARIEKRTGIERHTVAALLHNEAKYVSLEAIGKLCEYLVEEHRVERRLLPGVLLGRVPEDFWQMLAGCEQLDFCLGTRVSRQWRDAEYVMATDSRLQGVLLSKVSRFCDALAPPQAPPGKAAPQQDVAAARKYADGHCHPMFHLLRGPGRDATPEDPGPDWAKICLGASQLYQQRECPKRNATLALGSIKVNPMVELMLANIFSTEPFVVQDKVARPRDRRCPLWFCFRESDPKPPSCCGGVRLAAGATAGKPGLYYERDDGKWEPCLVDERNDAAFLFYRHRLGSGRVEVACGGFSSRATHCLTEDIEAIVAALGEPQFETNDLRVGMYVIRFTFGQGSGGRRRPDSERPFRTEVLPLAQKVLARRLLRQTGGGRP